MTPERSARAFGESATQVTRERGALRTARALHRRVFVVVDVSILTYNGCLARNHMNRKTIKHCSKVGFLMVTVVVASWLFATLSFAKNSSADMSLRHNAFITVMQAAELRDLDDPSRTRDLTRKWTLLVEPQMGPRSVVVSEIRSQGSLEMLPVQDHEMIQAVSSNGAD